MKKQQTLKRNYHGYEIISVQNLEPVENSDGWKHTVFNNEEEQVGTAHTLSDAIWLARNVMASGEVVQAPEPGAGDTQDPNSDIPESEEHE